MISDQHNDARYKLSPFKTLSSEQLQLKNKVMAFIHTHLGQSQHLILQL